MGWKKRLLTLLAIVGATSGCSKDAERMCYAPMPPEKSPQERDAEDLDKAEKNVDELEAADKLSPETADKAREQIERERED